MTDADADAATPGGDQTTEQSTDPEVTADDIAQVINDLRHDLGASHAKAMDRLETEYGIETERELYQELGFPADLVTVEVTIFDAELYALIDLLERVSRETMPAQRYVATANTLDKILNDVDAEMVHELAEEGIDEPLATENLEDEEGDDGE